MNELYWITRLTSLNNLFYVSTVVFGTISLLTAICHLIKKDEYVTNGSDSDKLWMDCWKRISKWSVGIFIVSLPLAMLIPTSKEAMLIWGVGSTIDYIKGNDTIKQIPDKCINALDAWVESLTDEKKEEKK